MIKKNLLLNFLEGKRIKLAFGLFLVFSISYLLFSNPENIVLKPSEPVQKETYTQTDEYKYIISLQKSFIQVAKSIKPAVVNISTLSQIKKTVSGFHFFNNEFSFESFQSFLELFFEPKQYQVENLGSGVIFSSKGHILTNYHVVENAEHLLIRLSDDRKFEGTLIGMDKKTDLAVIKINSFNSLPKAPLGDSNNLKAGQWVIAIGNPYGLDRTVTVGVVSAKGRSGIGITTYENFIQTDASINPGNSGGPLLDLEGNVIGINTAIIGQGTGIGFAIPIDMVKLISKDLIKKGTVERGWLGAGIQALSPELARTFKTDYQKGVLVNKIIPEAPAFNGGLKQGDIIVFFDGNAVTSPKELQNMVALATIGETIEVKVFRNGKAKNLKIKVAKMES
ncbi:MAG: trypsin-like peptidase domain-containing protein [Nitrospinota bacterium]|nr:trypsin-like peptidase domain-containing protein [Nitrospinota bacterium]